MQFLSTIRDERFSVYRTRPPDTGGVFEKRVTGKNGRDKRISAFEKNLRCATAYYYPSVYIKNVIIIVCPCDCVAEQSVSFQLIVHGENAQFSSFALVRTIIFISFCFFFICRRERRLRLNEKTEITWSLRVCVFGNRVYCWRFTLLYRCSCCCGQRGKARTLCYNSKHESMIRPGTLIVPSVENGKSVSVLGFLDPHNPGFMCRKKEEKKNNNAREYIVIMGGKK